MLSLFLSKKKNLTHTSIEISRQYVRFVVLEEQTVGYVPVIFDEIVLAYNPPHNVIDLHTEHNGQDVQIMWDEIRDALDIITKKHVVESAHIVIPEMDMCGQEMCGVHNEQCIKAIASYAHLIKEFGITPLSIQTESQAITRVATDSLNLHESVVLVSVGIYQTVVTLSKGGVPHMTKTIFHPRITDFTQENKSAIRWRKDISRMLFYVYEKEGARQQYFKKEIYMSGDISREAIEQAKCFLEDAVGNAHLETLPVWRHCFSLQRHIPIIHYQDMLRYANVIGGALTGVLK